LTWSIAKFSRTVNGRSSSLASVSGNRSSAGGRRGIAGLGLLPCSRPAYAEEREPLPPNVAHDC